MRCTYKNLIKVEESGDWVLLKRSEDKRDTYDSEFADDLSWEFTTEMLTSCPYLSKVFGGAKVFAVAMAGSYLPHLKRPRSDWDLECYALGDEPKDEWALTYKGRLMHWYYATPARYGSTDAIESFQPSYLAGVLKWHWLKREHFIWTDGSDFAKAFVDAAVDGFPKLAPMMAEVCCAWDMRNGQTKFWAEAPTSKTKRLRKAHWIRYFAPALLLGDEIDMGFILDFKNAAGNGLPEERAEQFRDVCRRWLATHEVPTKDETVALEQRLADAWAAIWAKAEKGV